jgi:hypothetical protein
MMILANRADVCWVARAIFRVRLDVMKLDVSLVINRVIFREAIQNAISLLLL